MDGIQPAPDGPKSRNILRVVFLKAKNQITGNSGFAKAKLLNI